MFRPAALGVVAAFLAGAAAAQPQTNRPDLAVVCVDVNGALLAPACRQGLATRVAPTEDACICPRGQRIEAPVCPPGVAQPPDSLAVNRARNEILRHQSTLVGAAWQGHPLCVAPAQP